MGTHLLEHSSAQLHGMPPKRAASAGGGATRTPRHGGSHPAFFHLAPDGTREPYSAADCKAISAARMRGLPSVRVSDVTLPNGKVLEFEVRLGSNAVSQRMPKPPQSRMIQVNLGNENTRVVLESMSEPTLGAPPAHAAPAPSQARDESAPEPEPQAELQQSTSQPDVQCYDDVIVELVGMEASDTYRIVVCEEQNRILLNHTGEVQEQSFQELEGSFRTAAFTNPEAAGGGFFGQGLASPFYLTMGVDFSERLSEPGVFPHAV